MDDPAGAAPSGANYADAGALVADMQRLGGANSAEWGSTKITYDLVPVGGLRRRWWRR